jgi:hypothetical protein
VSERSTRSCRTHSHRATSALLLSRAACGGATLAPSNANDNEPIDKRTRPAPSSCLTITHSHHSPSLRSDTSGEPNSKRCSAVGEMSSANAVLVCVLAEQRATHTAYRARSFELLVTRINPLNTRNAITQHAHTTRTPAQPV